MAILVGAENITRRRFSTAGAVRGADRRYVPGAASLTVISASVQPLRGREVETLPEGERHKDWQKVYTAADLVTADQHAGGAGGAADQLDIGGITYEVRQVWPWRGVSPIPHFKAFVVRLQEVAP
jgi:hypothetical protein